MLAITRQSRTPSAFSDSLASKGDQSRSFTDAVGITDSLSSPLTASHNFFAAISDTVGFTLVLSPDYTFVRSFANTVLSGFDWSYAAGYGRLGMSLPNSYSLDCLRTLLGLLILLSGRSAKASLLLE